MKQADRSGMKKKHLYALAVLFIILAAGFLSFGMFRQRGSVRVRPSQPAGSSDIICYLQSDPAWAEDSLGTSSYPMKSSGCLTVCLTAALQYEGIMPETIAGAADSIDPGALNTFLSKEQVYDSEGNIQWEPLENALDITAVRQGADGITGKTLEKLLTENIYPIVRVRVNGSGSFHYVLIVNSDGKEFWCMDPMNSSDSLVPLSDFDNRIYAVRYIYRE